MAGFNRVIFMGNLTRDPEYKQISSGQAVSKLSLATNRQYKNKQTGEMVQEVCYIEANIWGSQAESCRQYLQKGSSVLVEGRLKLETWQDNSGQNRQRHSIMADRVVFIQLGTSTEVTEETYAPSKPAESNNLEKDLLDQIEEIKSKSKSKSKSKVEDIPLRDEPPFQDDLPF